VAAYSGKSGKLQILWEWANKNLTTEEINIKILLGTDNEGRTTCHVAAYSGNSGKLQILWEWANENLTTEEINIKI
jgi:hypothetical protein